MTAKRKDRLSFAAREPQLSKATPASLANLRALRPTFDQVRDPSLGKQRAARKTEAQRGEGGRRGSTMVKRHRPFPELRPRHAQEPIRAAFHQAWVREQRAAQLARFQAARVSGEQENRGPSPALNPALPGRGR